MAKALSALLTGIAAVTAEDDRTIAGITLDSRSVRAGFLFIALPGGQCDGRAYIADAIARGAVAVIAEHPAPDGGGAVPTFTVQGLRRRIGEIAERFFGHPSRQLQIVGVTGTNGKTTCTHLLAQALSGGARRCGVIGTIGNGFPRQLKPATHTTPDAVHLSAILADLLAAGATDVAMEVSSHALDQDRVGGLAFAGAVFTNLTRDHLDYHGTMEAYAAAKARLFDVEPLRFAVCNTDDPFGVQLRARVAARGIPVLGFGFDSGDVRIVSVTGEAGGLAVGMRTPAGAISVRSQLFGRFNALNLAAVTAVLLLDGRLSLPEIAEALSQVQPVPGRMERFGGRGRPLVVVDYAHTPDALEQALRALREHVQGRLFCVFGCGGDRDVGKRSQMGQVAQSLADAVILTDDNPRRESGDAIIASILEGMRHPAPEVLVERDRRRAIARALEQAGPADAILVAGKGHEDYQEVGRQKLPFSDRDSVCALLEAAT